MAKTEFLTDGDTFTHKGRTFHVSIERDADHVDPWVENDGHGPVSEWTTRDKMPGEKVLTTEGGGHRFYDVAEATRIAKREGWGLSGEAMQALMRAKDYHFRNAHNKNRLHKLPQLAGPVPAPTRGEIIAQAVQKDFEYLRRWCTDDWHYVGVCVRHESQDDSEKYSYACWGVSSDDDAHIAEIAHDCAAECLAAIEEEKAQERENLKTQRAQFSAIALELRNSSALGPVLCGLIREKLAGIITARHSSMARIAELSA